MSKGLPVVLVAGCCLLLTGCRTMSTTSRQDKATQEALDAVGSVTGALTGKELTEAERRKVLHDLKNDKEAQSAMRSISGALQPECR